MGLSKRVYRANCYDSLFLLPINIPTMALAVLSDQTEYTWLIVLAIIYFLIACSTYSLLFYIFKQGTPGMRKMGMKIVDKNGGIPSKREILKRVLYVLPLIFVYIISSMTYFDREKWEREVLGTVLVIDE